MIARADISLEELAKLYAKGQVKPSEQSKALLAVMHARRYERS